jgi:hypothetical protein
MKKLWQWLRGMPADLFGQVSNESLACLLLLRQLALYANTGVTNTTATRHANQILAKITPVENR